MVATDGRRKVFSEEEEREIQGFIEEKKKTGEVYLGDVALKSLQEWLAKKSGCVYSPSSLRMSVGRRLGRIAVKREKETGGKPVPVTEKSLNQIHLNLERVKRVVKREFCRLACEGKRSKGLLKKELQAMKKENQGLKQEISRLKSQCREYLEMVRGLKKIQAAVEDFQKKQ